MLPIGKRVGGLVGGFGERGGVTEAGVVEARTGIPLGTRKSRE